MGYTTTDTGVKTKATAWTVGVHVLLLLLLLLVRFSVGGEPLGTTIEEGGLEVNLGNSPDGSGDDQPMAINDPSQQRNEEKRQTASKQEDGMNDMERSDDPDAPEIGAVKSTDNRRVSANIQNDSRRRTNQQQTSPNNRIVKDVNKFFAQNGTGTGGNGATNNVHGTSEGKTTGTGDAGVNGGTPGAENYSGTPGNGNGGIGHNLSGRDISPARFEATFHEGGKVKVQVTVDRDGNIISKRIISSPNKELNRIALQKLSEAKFSRSPNAAPEQIGIVTIIFKARS